VTLTCESLDRYGYRPNSFYLLGGGRETFADRAATHPSVRVAVLGRPLAELLANIEAAVTELKVRS
jgi:hypothetical protein